MHVVSQWTALLFYFLPVLATSACGQEVDYIADVQPILQKHCYPCHGETRQKSGLRLDIKSEAFKGGDGWGQSIVPGQAAESPLIELITSEDPEMRMPPEGEGLASEEISALRLWVESGAEWPDGVDSAKLVDRRDHWSFKPPTNTLLDIESSSIDAFIDARLAEVGLSRNSPADSSSLVRRIYFDLTGLPPTPQEIASYKENPNAEALVNQLLASNRYGERWAQHWLDVIRWAETVGFETNAERHDAWHYRDWVIAALNNDMPYNQFVYEQICGDTTSSDAALGFLVAGPANLPGQIGRDEAAMRSARQDELDEVINTVSQSILGLTVGCARCHDHKFDPITQRDYYAMQAVFANLHYGTRRLRGIENDQWTAQVPGARDARDQLLTELEAMRQHLQLRPAIADVHTETFPPVLATAVRMTIDATNNGSAASLYEFEIWSRIERVDVNVALASNGSTPSASSFALANQSRHFDNLVDGSVDQRQAYPWISAAAGTAWIQVDLAEPRVIERIVMHRGSSMPTGFRIEVLSPDSADWKLVANSHDRMPRVDDTRKAEAIRIVSQSGEPVSADTTKTLVQLLAKFRAANAELAKLSAGPQVYAASFSPKEPRATHLLHRGDAMQQREVVVPNTPAFLGALAIAPEATEAEIRDSFARHLIDPQHPLTARVIVNRVWQHHFGTGLVRTPSDFGRMGTPPSHPELLDWLAARFIADGWSLKKLHSLIMASGTYRQASTPNPEALAVDANSRFLWRFPPRRLEAEAIRDSILSVSGKLNLTVGGRGFSLFNQRGGLADYKPLETFGEDGWRRMIYAHKVRMIAVDVFGAFDCPDAGQMKPRRTRSITPLQSLGLFNSPFVLRQAGFFAERVRDEAGPDVSAQVAHAFKLANSREPTERETERMRMLANEHGIASVCRAILNTSEFVWIR